MIKTLKFNGWTIELDTAEVFPNDPGNGTPAMVYSPKNESATYWRACDMGTIGDNDAEIPSRVLNWLNAQEETVNSFLYPDIVE